LEEVVAGGCYGGHRREVVTWGARTASDRRMSRVTIAARTSRLMWTLLDARDSCGAIAARTSWDATVVHGLCVSSPLEPRVRHRRSPPSGALSPLARLPWECHHFSPASGPWGHRCSPLALYIGEPPPPRLQIEESPPQCVRVGEPSPRVLGQPPLSPHLGGRCRSFIGMWCQKMSPSALGLIL
jgi:hypothetical protein